MSVPDLLANIAGRWHGVNRLHTSWIPENPIRESVSTAVIDLTARGRFLKIEYDWIFEDAPQEGLILVGDEKGSDLIKAFWIDSWHLSDKFMVSEGTQNADRALALKGFYTVPDHPDWGWRTVFENINENSFKITMYNVTPEGEESLAVEMEFQKQS